MAFKWFRSYSALLVIPGVFLIIFFVNVGPTCLDASADPNYTFLINGLNIATGAFVGWCDHPGIPLHIFSGIILRLTNLFSAKEELITEVFTHPEYYIFIIKSWVAILNAVGILFFGIFFKGRARPWQIIILQSFLIYIPIQTIIFQTLVSDAFLGVLTTFLVTIVLHWDRDSAKYSDDTKVLLIGFICGLGLATKITFAPVILLPMFVLFKRLKIVLVSLVCGSFFFLFLIPALPNFMYMVNWFGKMFLSSEMYGARNPNTEIVKFAHVKDGLLILWDRAPLFLITWLCAIGTLLKLFFTKGASKKHRLLFYVSLVISVSVILILKHFKVYYLMPIFVLAPVFIFYTLMELVPIKFRARVWFGVAILLCCTFIIQFPVIRENYFQNQENIKSLDNLHKVYDKLGQSKPIIEYAGFTAEFSSLLAGSYYTLNRVHIYNEKIKELYPNLYHYSCWFGSGNKPFELNELISKHRVVYIVLPSTLNGKFHFDLCDIPELDFNLFRVNPVIKEGGFILYRVTR